MAIAEAVNEREKDALRLSVKTCPKCKESFTEEELDTHLWVCPSCGAYIPMPARVRVDLLSDTDTFEELFGEEVFTDPLGFPDYREKYTSAKAKSRENEGVLCGVTRIEGQKTAIFVMNPEFMLGSMGTVVGDRITALFEYALKNRLPVVGFTVSGGARMHAGLLYIVGLTDPTMGGVTASFAMLGDIIFSEPNARIGFAGKRVVEQVTGEKLPDEFQTAEFQLRNGFLDEILPREEQRIHIGRLLSLHEPQ